MARGWGLAPPLPHFRRAVPLTFAIPARSKCSGLNDWGQLGLGDMPSRGDDANNIEDSMVAMRNQHWQNYEKISSAVNP